MNKQFKVCPSCNDMAGYVETTFSINRYTSGGELVKQSKPIRDVPFLVCAQCAEDITDCIEDNRPPLPTELEQESHDD